MQHSVTVVERDVKTIILDEETYALIDPAYDLVTVHRGQVGEWGGQCIGSLPFDFLRAIAKVLPPTGNAMAEAWKDAVSRIGEQNGGAL